MAFIYAMSDIHGEKEIFQEMLGIVDLEDRENQLILLGDYISRDQQNCDLLYVIRALTQQYPTQIVVLMGNHELMLLDDLDVGIARLEDQELIAWLRGLPFYYETPDQLYVHAGVDEEAGEYWKWGSEDYYFCSKYPHTIGKFYKDVIAGHIGTSTIAKDQDYHQVYWDRKSHYYIDGTTELSKVIPLLKYNTVSKRYSSFEKTVDQEGKSFWMEYGIGRR